MKSKTSKTIRKPADLKRRTVLKAGAAVAAAAIVPTEALADEKKTKIVVVHGTNLAKMVEAGMARMGGWDKFFKAEIGGK